MLPDRLTKYIWIIDTINQYGSISRARLSQLWQASDLGNGNPLPHRTFFTYRRAIEQQLGVSIKCNGANEYYIDHKDTLQDVAYRNWMLDSYAMRGVLEDNRDIADRIHVEPIPSARQHLATVVQAIRTGKTIEFTHHSYTRPRPDTGISFEPFFLKLFRQRWYMVGRRVSDKEIRTYALDRITDLSMTSRTFTPPPDLTAESYFSQIYGITQSRAPASKIKLQVRPQTAKYLRTLPLHESQREEQFSDYSIFNYELKLTDDLVRHLLSLGNEVKVLQPATLRLMLLNKLKDTLAQYDDPK